MIHMPTDVVMLLVMMGKRLEDLVVYDKSRAYVPVGQVSGDTSPDGWRVDVYACGR